MIAHQYTYMKSLYLFLALLLSGTGATLKAQSAELEKAWNAFTTSDYKNAAFYFEKAALQPAYAAEAYTGLGYTYAANHLEYENEEAFWKFAETNPSDLFTFIALWQQNRTRLPKNRVKLLEKMAGNTTNGTVKAFIYQALGHHEYYSGNLKNAIKEYAKVGSITKWQLLGEFENISESGFDKDFGALDHPEPDHQFKNKRGVPVKWFQGTGSRIDNWVDLEAHFYALKSIAYAQNFCLSPSDQKVQFRLGTSGSVKVWVNDDLVFKEAKETDNDLDTYIFEVHLKKGYNRILLQLGSSDIYNMNFLLRITDDTGNNLNGLEFSNQYQKYPKKPGHTIQVIESEIHQHLQQITQKQPENIAYQLIFGQYEFLKLGNGRKAQERYQKLSEKYPRCSYIHHLHKMALDREGNSIKVAELNEMLKKQFRHDPAVLLQLIEEAIDSEKKEEANKLMNEYIERAPESGSAFAMAIRKASFNKQMDEMVNISKAAYNKFPNEVNFVLGLSKIENEINKNKTAAIFYLEKYLKKAYSTQAISELVDIYFETGQPGPGINYLNQLIDYNPQSTEYKSILANILFMINSREGAEAHFQRCTEIAPYKGTYYNSLGRVHKELKNESKAIEMYQRALELNPTDYDSREALLALTNTKSPFSEFTENQAEEMLKKSPDAKSYPDDNAIVLLDAVEKVVYKGGGAEEQITTLVKVFNNAGVDAWKEYNITTKNGQRGNLEKAIIFKKNGTRVPAEHNNGHLVFQNLEPGDGIYITYKLQNYQWGKLTEHFWDKFLISYNFPVAVSRYKISVPKGTKFQYKTVNTDLQPVIETQGEFEAYTWESKDIPAIKYETGMPTLSDAAQVLHISSFPDWNFIGEWYSDLANSKAKADVPEVQALLQQLLEGQSNLSVEQKVQRFYEYIVNNIRYSSVPFIQSGLIPQSASQVIHARQGDCKDVSTLFVALCKDAGIPAQLVLINTRENGKQDLILPSIEFNHCIAKVTVDQKPVYLELTGENLPLGSGKFSVEGATALEIPTGPNQPVTTAQLLYASSRKPAVVKRQVSIQFNDANIQVKKVCSKSGEGASGLRDTYEHLSPDQMRKTMQEAIADEYPGVKLDHVKFLSGLDNNDYEVTYEYAYKAEDVFTSISGLEIFKAPFTDVLESSDLLNSDDRKYPILLWQLFMYDQSHESIVIDIPASKKIAEVPPAEKIANAYMSYEVSYALKDNQLRIERHVHILKDEVPVADFLSFRQDLSKMVKSDSRKLAFSKK